MKSQLAQFYATLYLRPGEECQSYQLENLPDCEKASHHWFALCNQEFVGSNPVGLGDFRAFDLVGNATLKEVLLVEGNFTDFLQKRNVKTCNKAKKLKIQRLND